MQKNTKVVKFPNSSSQTVNENKNVHKKKRKINLMNLIFIVFLLYFFMTATSQKQMINALDTQIAQKEAQRDTIKKKADKLSEDVESIDDEKVLLEVVERIARNEYKMVKPNEIIYIDKNKMSNKFIMGIGYDDNEQAEDTVNDENKIKIDDDEKKETNNN